MFLAKWDLFHPKKRQPTAAVALQRNEIFSFVVGNKADVSLLCAREFFLSVDCEPVNHFGKCLTLHIPFLPAVVRRPFTQAAAHGMSLFFFCATGFITALSNKCDGGKHTVIKVAIKSNWLFSEVAAVGRENWFLNYR